MVSFDEIEVHNETGCRHYIMYMDAHYILREPSLYLNVLKVLYVLCGVIIFLYGLGHYLQVKGVTKLGYHKIISWRYYIVIYFFMILL